MREALLSAQLSPLDTQRFGVRTARARVTTVEEVPEVLDFCAREGVQFLIARCRADDLRIAHQLEQAGGRLMDTLVYYRRDLRKAPVPEEKPPVLIRPARPEDEEAIRHVATEAFRGYRGHYHADPRLDPAKADEAYVDWAVRSCRGELADEVLVAVGEKALLGFVSLCFGRSGEAEGRLFGVSPEAWGKGVSRALMVEALRWCQRRGALYMSISTQLTNIAVQKVWVRVGFEPSHAYYTFHVWFD
jgi:GNAT superfamily N-acetyltransferase